jgi:penicillin-binding protein 1A
MLLFVEDKRFSIHFGADPIAIVRAALFNLRGGSLQGGSTIAQQVYTIRQRNRLRRTRPRTFLLKLKQSAWASLYSATNSKAVVLQEYVNTVYWGRSYYGLDRAAEGYFRVTRSTLSISQSFFLAERIAAPNRLSIRRISNLLGRTPIQESLACNGATTADVIALYKQIYGCGGEIWPVPAK